MRINQFIQQNNLQPADALELASPTTGYPKHYALFLGMKNSQPEFIANITDGVQVIKDQRLFDFMLKYQITTLERFNGTSKERNAILKKAISRLGEKAYNLVFNNCEHFKNWVLYCESKSQQVMAVGTGLLISGSTFYITGVLRNRKVLEKLGLALLILLAVFILLGILFTKNITDQTTPEISEYQRFNRESSIDGD